jgi:hypothetical protein
MVNTNTPFLLQADAFAQQKVEWFMLGLLGSRRSYYNYVDLPPLPTGKFHVDVVADYLSKLRESICVILRRSFDMEEIHIQWWCAIPPFWDGISEACLRGSALLAGFVRGGHDDKILFITEPVAYVLHCCNTLLLDPQPSDAFLVVVAGKGTVDLVAYEATSGHPLALKQLTSPSGDACG